VLMPVTPGDLPERPKDLVAINLPKSIRTVWFLKAPLRADRFSISRAEILGRLILGRECEKIHHMGPIQGDSDDKAEGSLWIPD